MKPSLRPSFTRPWPCIASNFSTFFFQLPTPLTHARNITQIRHRHIHSSPSPPPPPQLASSPPPLLPLFLRPPEYTTTVSDLLEWHSWAKSLAASIGSSFEDSDNGPDSTLLCRELNWLMEDVLDGSDPSLMHKAVARDDPDTIISLKADVQELYSLWKQRIDERRPFQYIVGCQHWRDLILCVREGVLIPRPETEIIVELVGDVISKDEGLREGLWADLGTGSGAIAIGIAKILGNYGRVIATDLNPVAVQVASFNVERYSLQDKIEVREGSWWEPLKGVEGKVAGLVSNPPYIPSDDISGLQAEVGRHEPRLALDGGAEGMDDLLHLCNGAASMLKPGGFFAFEVFRRQAATVDLCSVAEVQQNAYAYSHLFEPKPIRVLHPS
ncbi:release factor glutamine methyltransferase isoform X2 [Rhodamnia argentea]|uniref:Release factor glutamine methyltransferase isoform X2 n=1 Tax=Rhodamnia argentea TaxID=178133 RepID=A0ABM3GYU6_9MYRT|nr:release factor glutamine methyltransferase isoform X2 [Rhodamnia argentea]